MLGIFDNLAAPEAARVAGDLSGTVENAQADVIGDQGQSAAGVLWGDGIAIGVEANESLGVDMDRHDLVGGRQRVGQGEQARALLGKDIGDSAWGQHGMWARMGNVGDELLELLVTVVHAEDGAASEEAVAQVANGALDTALVLRLTDATQARLCAHFSAQ